MTVEEVKIIAEGHWTHQPEFQSEDKELWINGFTVGYLIACIDKIDEQITYKKEKLAATLIERIDGINCEYSGLPSVKSYEEDSTFKQKSKWTKVKNKQQ
jgi:hypothetical protein